jgi:hypothetical protein
LLISLAEHLAHAEIEFQSSVDTFNGSRGIISNGKMTWRAGNLNSKVVLNGIRERQARTHTAHTQMSERPRRVERVGVAGLSDLLASSSRLRRRSQRKFIRADNLTSTARNNFSNPARSVSVSRAAHTAAPREFVHTKKRSRALGLLMLLLLLDVCKIYPPTDCECISLSLSLARLLLMQQL